MAQKFNTAAVMESEKAVQNAQLSAHSLPNQIYIFQKDSRSVSIFSPQTGKIVQKYVEYRGNFPHNFQMIQVGTQDPRVYMIGGGEYKSLPDSMFQCNELVAKSNSNQFSLQFVQKKNMRYARHGHSCCAIQNRFILVTGSRKEVNLAAHRVEIYDTENDEWLELSKINDGRHYHSSCTVDNNYVFIFGGIENSNKKYSNSIERLHLSFQNFNNPWEKIQMPQQNPIFSPISARQGAGMCQLSHDEIMIVGGFNGQFLSDNHILKFDKSNYRIISNKSQKNSPL